MGPQLLFSIALHTQTSTHFHLLVMFPKPQDADSLSLTHALLSFGYLVNHIVVPLHCCLLTISLSVRLLCYRDFLPRGSGIVTRRPLVLQLINSPTGKNILSIINIYGGSADWWRDPGIQNVVLIYTCCP